MLRKLFGKVFITKKCTERKTLHALKSNVFELSENKNVWKLFSKHELFSLDQANYSSNPSQILIVQYSMLRASLSLSPYVWNFILANWNPCSTQSSSRGLHLFPCFIPTHATIIWYTKSFVKPNQSDLLSSYIRIIIPYWSNALPKKKLSLSEPFLFHS